MQNDRESTPHFDELLQARVSRRQVLAGGITATTAALFGGLGLYGCGSAVAPGAAPAIPRPRLGFTAIAKSIADTFSLPPGYSARVLLSWGQPLMAGGTLPDKIANLTAEQQANALGDHHDGMYYFGLGAGNAVPGTPDRENSTRGLLAMNHEAITEDFAHPRGPSFDNLEEGELTSASARTSTEECLKEMALHGISVSELAQDAEGQFQLVQGSPYNRRITVNTEMDLSGPVAAKPELVLTAFSAQPGKATKARGTLNNCAHGYTPWGTYLTCEENWAGYFGNSAASIPAEQARYNIGLHGFQQLRWYSAPDTPDFSMSRFQLNPTGASAADDFRNEANTFGYVVEIDPYDPNSTPKKRTALGRMAHEGAWPRFEVGRRIAFYMGDDNRNDYFYKFVTDAVYTGNEPRINDILDHGTLYAARFNAEGTGTWLPLTVAALADPVNFPTLADICVKTRQAADAAGATRMDRPEWGAVNPRNGEVYLTLTNNSNRRPAGATLSGSQLATDAANPRAYEDQRGSATNRGNVNGHIIRLRETADDPAAETFTWDIYLFGAQADADPVNVNISGLDAGNDLSSPDGLWFDPRGLLWIQTDDGAYTDVTNCMMLAAVPGAVGDGGSRSVQSTTSGVSSQTMTHVGKPASSDSVRRFLVGPKGCEITGVDITPDGRTMFVNIQHPGENGGFDSYDQSTNTFTAQSLFNVLPGDDRARSATLVITRDDGGIIGL